MSEDVTFASMDGGIGSDGQGLEVASESRAGTQDEGQRDHPVDPRLAQAALDGLRDVPSSSDGYDLAIEVPEGLAPAWNQSGVDSFGEIFKEAGLTRGQARTLLQAYAKRMETVVADAQAQRESTVQGSRVDPEGALRREWGRDFSRKLEVAKATLAQGCAAAGVDLAELTGESAAGGGLIGNSAALAKVLAAIGEGQASNTPGNPGAVGQRYDLLDTQIAAMQSDPAYSNSGDPRHGIVLRQLEILFRQRYGEG